ncbi:hypothetical protein K2173_008869 [Erythroxylum novogranatense]|uniref:Uncharacterized protein n=1 Tax=Erythroxylum novogranatense TaxID=1862640 RepID=A0AAV8U987_9ROSI|nr:hypothetical protein K2173_008869 [Erythroxylum novogranatense]
MAVAAFKSSSRRASNPASDKENKDNPTSRSRSIAGNKPPPRRSRSVSATPRSHLEASPSSRTQTPTSTPSSSWDFLVKRDNPLYWSSTTISPSDKNDEFASNTSKLDEPTSRSAPLKPKSPSSDCRRGRSVSRKKDFVKSDSRTSKVDVGRRARSVSRLPVARSHFVNSETAVEDVSLLTKYKNRNDWSTGATSNVGAKGTSVRSDSSGFDETKSMQPRLVDSSSNLPSSPTQSLEDMVLGTSFLEAEERTIKAVYEQMKSFQRNDYGGDSSSCMYETVRSEVRRAISDIQDDLETVVRRNNVANIATTNITDIPPDLVNPCAVELVLDIRREFANKLEQSRDRARQLRADLALEEHRGLELSRILKEVLPDPNTPNVQKSRPGRKCSTERRRMSKRLSEEAMAYFDECVSLSTFDSSDFSSQEDAPFKLMGIAPPSGDPASFSQAGSSLGANHWPSSSPCEKQEACSVYSYDDASRQLPTRQWDRKSRFSFSKESSGTFDSQQQVNKCVKVLEKDPSISTTTHYDLDEYSLQASEQSFLFDRLFSKNRMESGSMLLCGAGFAISLSPFTFLI